MAFANGIGAGEIHAQLVAQHESHIRDGHVLVGTHADAHHDTRRRLELVERLALFIEEGDADYAGAGVAVAMVDIGDGLDDFRRADALSGWPIHFVVRFVPQIAGVLFHHGGEVF